MRQAAAFALFLRPTALAPMGRFAWFTALAIAFAAPAVASPQTEPCPGFDGHPSSLDVDQFYGARSLDIIRAGLTGDTETLTAMISPQATFEIWRGDNVSSARHGGVRGLLEMAKDLKPGRFQISAVRPSPVYVTALKCEWSATILFRTEQPDVGVTVKFDFVDGRLVRASGHEVVLSEGSVP